jgi:hypothetical protein
MVSCCCWVLYRWWLDRPLVYRSLWVWRIPNRNVAAALLHNNNFRNDQLLHRDLQHYTNKAPEFYTTTYDCPGHYTDALKYYSAPSYYTTKVTEYYITTHAAPSYFTEAPKYYSQLLIALIFLNTTMFPAATPRLPLITPPKRSNATPKRQSTTLPRSTQTQLRRPSITQSRLATQKLLFRATLNWNTTLILQSTTPRPTLHLAVTPQPPSTTPKKPPITQPRTLPGILHRGI